MSDAWQYQLRIYLPDELVETARLRSDDPALGQLPEILQKHGASMKSQFDAFAEYVVEAERNGTEQYPLYQWTKATIEDPAKKQKHLKSFSLHVKGRELYSKDEANSLEADLQPLVGGGVITRISKHDSNPEHNPQMPERYRKRGSAKLARLTKPNLCRSCPRAAVGGITAACHPLSLQRNGSFTIRSEVAFPPRPRSLSDHERPEDRGVSNKRAS